MTLKGDLNREVRLIARPAPSVTADLFEVCRTPVPEPGEGQFLIKVLFLSLDPAMRGWIMDVPNYRKPVALGEVMPGFTVGQVVASRHRDYRVGELVAGRQGWCEWALSDGSDIDRKVEADIEPISAYLHVLGINGITAYFGLLEVGQPREGETVVVSTGAGAVGSFAGQIAKIKGCRTVAITGSDEKVRTCRALFGYDAAINYKTAGDLGAALAEACPQGVDVYFDNTGGPITDAVIERINERARIVICGTMGIGPETLTGPRYHRQLLVKRARMEGFLFFDHEDRSDEAVEVLSRWFREGRLKFLEDVADGLEKAPEMLCRLLAGDNKGKALVRVGGLSEKLEAEKGQ